MEYSDSLLHSMLPIVHAGLWREGFVVEDGSGGWRRLNGVPVPDKVVVGTNVYMGSTPMGAVGMPFAPVPGRVPLARVGTGRVEEARVEPVIVGIDGVGAVARGSDPDEKNKPVERAVAVGRGTPELPDANGLGSVAFGRGKGISISESMGVRL